MIPAFPKIYHVGAPEISSLFHGPVEVTEKLDGSQIGFGKTKHGEFCIRSKGAPIYFNGTFQRSLDKLFNSAVQYLLSIQDKISDDTHYYGEVISSNRHNTLTYRSVPRNFIVIYGICSEGHWVDDHEILTREADRLGFDAVELMYAGVIDTQDKLKELLERESYYGGTKIEGVVVKNYNQASTSPFSSKCFGKYVSDRFKEMNGANWSEQKKANSLQTFLESFTNEARWDKAIQHLRDDGKLQGNMRDIPSLMPYIANDVEEECGEMIKEKLYKMFIRQVKSYAVKGFPEYYKQKLLDNAFKKEEDCEHQFAAQTGGHPNDCPLGS